MGPRTTECAPLGSAILSLVTEYLSSDCNKLQGVYEAIRPHARTDELCSHLVEEFNEVLDGVVTRVHKGVLALVGTVSRVSGIGHRRVVPPID